MPEEADIVSWKPRVGPIGWPDDASMIGGDNDIYSAPPTFTQVNAEKSQGLNQVISEINRRLSAHGKAPLAYITPETLWDQTKNNAMKTAINTIRQLEENPAYQWGTWPAEFSALIIEDMRRALRVPPCGSISVSGGAGVTTRFHHLGVFAGTVNINYQMFSIQDRMDVYYRDVLVATTGGPVSGAGTLSFAYDPGETGDFSLKVVVTGPNGTAWNYTVQCPA